jgi:hypothetical protein
MQTRPRSSASCVAQAAPSVSYQALPSQYSRQIPRKSWGSATAPRLGASATTVPSPSSAVGWTRLPIRRRSARPAASPRPLQFFDLTIRAIRGAVNPLRARSTMGHWTDVERRTIHPSLSLRRASGHGWGQRLRGSVGWPPISSGTSWSSSYSVVLPGRNAVFKFGRDRTSDARGGRPSGGDVGGPAPVQTKGLRAELQDSTVDKPAAVH